MNEHKIGNITIDKEITFKEAMRIIDAGGLHTAFVVDENKKLLGVITDGDIKRAIQSGKDNTTKIKEILNPYFKHAHFKSTPEELKNLIASHFVTALPLLDDKERVIDVVFVSSNKEIKYYNEQTKLHNRPDRVLVIGGAGYIGSVLVRKLLNKGYKVTILDKFIYGKESVEDIKNHPDVKIIEGDTRNIPDIVQAISNADSVVHLAEVVGDPAAALNPMVTHQTNYLATKIIAEVCKYYQINRLIYASSCSVYGASKNESLLNEDSEVNPVSLYAKMKIASEKALKDIQDENFKPTILRFATVFGPSYRPRFDLVVNTLTAKAVRERSISIFGGNQWRPNVHVEDIADTIALLLEEPLSEVGGKVFNVGHEKNNYTINELGRLVNEAVPESKLILEERNVDLRDYKVNFKKLRDVINKKDWKEVKEGIDEIREFLKANPKIDHEHKKYSNIKFLGEENIN